MNQHANLSPVVIEALLRRERMALVGRLLGGVVHNISGPLQMITLPLDRMEMDLARGETPQLTKYWPHLKQGISKLLAEVELLGSKVLNLHDLEPRKIDLAEMAQEQLAFWRADMFFKHQVELVSDLPFGRVTLQAAYADVALAFNAVMANALESLEAAKQTGLKIKVHQQPGQAGLLVEDSGPGPEPSLAQRMFEPFVGNKGENHDGLGLFLAREALARWRGELHWRPGAPGGFFIAFPATA